ncbi:MAG: class I SAM-dependent methyltransferase [Nanoarchaeota archaeon]|nr:class I SAM-dependent methyltransferase [Nanoarchaeota archaeon]
MEKYVYKDGIKIEKTTADETKTVLSKNPIVRWFSRTKMEIALKMAKLKKNDIILDFGCGDCYLKKSNPKFNIIGYDINPKKTEIEDYTTIHPTKIFAMDVLEHIPKGEIIEILSNFKKMNPNVELIVAIPTENWVSRKARLLLGKSERVRDHITPLKEILKILKTRFKLKKKKNFLTVTYIAIYSPKGKS